MAKMKCVICGEKLDTKQSGSAQQVTGWAVNRSQGGANYIKKAVPTGKWAHGPCLDDRVIDVNQLTLEDFL